MPGALDPTSIVLRQGGGLRRHLTLTTVTAAFASVCDGDLTARAAAAAIAGLLDLDGDEVRGRGRRVPARCRQGRPAPLRAAHHPSPSIWRPNRADSAPGIRALVRLRGWRWSAGWRCHRAATRGRVGMSRAERTRGHQASRSRPGHS